MTYFTNTINSIIFIILITPLLLSFYNRYNGIEFQLSQFEQAFKEAREIHGSNGTFTWNNKEYNTKYKEELFTNQHKENE